jgi:serine/threonine protein kinase
MRGRMLVQGTLLQGRYRIARPIGRGGMGAVYEAIDARLHNSVAVKQTIVSNVELDRAFEAKLLAGVRHPALPVVIDYFVGSEGQFLVMQYIEGEDLAHLLQRRGACDFDDVLRWAFEALEALQYLHGSSPPIVHRDIKPANLKWTPGGALVLLDFGLAKGRRSDTTPFSEDRSLFGFTLRYAPLEQIEGRGTSARSDIYALGATLYHLATGVAPPSARERGGAVSTGQPDPLVDAHRVNARVGAAFSAILARAMALDATARFDSAAAMRSALLELPTVAAATKPPRRPTVSERRLDAAMASQAEVGKQIDLIVQVRFGDSPRLGLEDWPSRVRPTQIEQGSEPLQLTHPVDPKSGAQLPARLRIKLVAPDFTVAGAAEQVIDVPPDEYSKRLPFLLTPRHAGYCRVNIEVYSLDAVHLGTIPVEAEAVATGVAQSIMRVAHLVLGVMTRSKADDDFRGDADLLGLLKATRHAAAARQADLSVDAVSPRPAEVIPHAPPIIMAAKAGRAREDVGNYPTGVEPVGAARPGNADGAAELPVVMRARAAASAAQDDEFDTKLPAFPALQQSRESARAASADEPTVLPPRAHASSARPVWRAALLYATPMLAVISVMVWQAGQDSPTPTNVVARGPSVERIARPPDVIAPRDSADVDRQPPTQPPAMSVSPPPASVPERELARAVRPPVIPGESFDRPQVGLTVTRSEITSAGRLRLNFAIVNASTAPVRVVFDYSRTRALQEDGRVLTVVADQSGEGRARTFTRTIEPGERLVHWIEFTAPDPGMRNFLAQLESLIGGDDGAHFRAFAFRLD